jgi:N-acetylneuraminic acid mutarotase
MSSALDTSGEAIRWRNLPPLPKALAGHFTGVCNGDLLVAGGSYFDTPPWDGGKKQWVDTVYVLPNGGAEWRLVGRLPNPVASGAAVSTPLGMICIAGQTPDGYSAQCLRLQWLNGDLKISYLPELPQAVSMLSAACDGEQVYVAGGQASPSATSASNSFFELSLADGAQQWRSLPDLPLSGRVLPVLVCVGEQVYLMSGAALTGTPGGPVSRSFLTDVHVYSKSTGWKASAPLPQAVQAAAGIFWKGRVLVIGGNDGSLADREFELRERHPGFSRTVFAYDQSIGRWTQAGSMPISLVTSAAVALGEEFVIAGGEDRPAHRSAVVLAGRFS